MFRTVISLPSHIVSTLPFMVEYFCIFSLERMLRTLLSVGRSGPVLIMA